MDRTPEEEIQFLRTALLVVPPTLLASFFLWDKLYREGRRPGPMMLQALPIGAGIVSYLLFKKRADLGKVESAGLGLATAIAAMPLPYMLTPRNYVDPQGNVWIEPTGGVDQR